MRCYSKPSIFSIIMFLLLLGISNSTLDVSGNNTPQSSNIMRTVNFDGSDVVAVSICENGSNVYAGTLNSNLYSYNPTTNNILWEKHLEGEIEEVVASRDHHYVVASTDENVYLFDWNGNSLYNLSFRCWDVDISEDGRFFIFVTRPGQVLFCYNISSSTIMWDYTAPILLYQAEISDDGQLIVANSALGDLYILDNSKEDPTSDVVWKKLESEPLRYDISSEDNGDYLIAMGLNNSSIFVIDRKAETQWRYSPEIANWVAVTIEISDDGNIVVLGTSHFKTMIFHGSPVPSYEYTEKDLFGTVLTDLNDKSTYFAVGSDLGNIHLFSTNRECDTPIITHSFGTGEDNYDAILSIAIDSQQDRIAAGSRNDNLYIIERGIAICGSNIPMIHGYEPWIILIISLSLVVILRRMTKIRNVI